MSQVNKIDYMVGAFLSYLVTRKIAPVLLDETDDAKIIKFSTNNGEYDVYFKYTIGRKDSIKSKKQIYKWDIIYTQNDIEKIASLGKNGEKIYSVNLLGDKYLPGSELIALDVNTLKKCLGSDDVNENRRLTVKRQKGSNIFKCYGTALSDECAIKIENDIEKYMGF